MDAVDAPDFLPFPEPRRHDDMTAGWGGANDIPVLCVMGMILR